MTTKIKENTMKKIYEYITITMSVIGLSNDRCIGYRETNVY